MSIAALATRCAISLIMGLVSHLHFLYVEKLSIFILCISLYFQAKSPIAKGR